MKKHQKIMATFLLGSLAVVGCTPGAGPKQTAGGLIGGASGAVVGSQFGKGTGKLFGVALGTLAGAYLGGAIGAQMDARDRQLANESMQHALERLPDNKPSTWKNPNTQHSGQVKVTKTKEMPQQNMVCREFTSTVQIGGQQETVVGKACRDVRDPRAEWRIVK